MRTRRIGAGLAIAAVSAVVLAGCVQTPAPVIPTSEPSSKPVFASDAAALAAAKKAYVRYTQTSDEVANDGGTGVQRLEPLDTGEQFKRDKRSFSQMSSDGHHTVGSSSISDFSLESSEVSGSRAAIVAYVCLHIGGTQLLDQSGSNVGADRPLDIPLEVSFTSAAHDGRTLLLDRSDVWPGNNFCS